MAHHVCHPAGLRQKVHSIAAHCFELTRREVQAVENWHQWTERERFGGATVDGVEAVGHHVLLACSDLPMVLGGTELEDVTVAQLHGKNEAWG